MLLVHFLAIGIVETNISFSHKRNFVSWVSYKWLLRSITIPKFWLFRIKKIYKGTLRIKNSFTFCITVFGIYLLRYISNELIFMIKLNTLDLTVGGAGEEGEGVQIKVMRTRVYQKLAAEDQI